MVTKTLAAPLKASQLRGEKTPDWCAGCGDFGILNSIHQSLASLQIPPWELYFFSGVGCSGKTSQYVRSYAAHTLHGRVLPYAIGAKLSNPKLTVVAAGGDGDGLGIGAGHFVHAGRRNIDMTYIIFDNEVYGLTKGQASPTLNKGEQPKSLALPNINNAINPFGLALASGYTFIARSYAYDAKHLKATIEKAIQHKGMALIDVVQPCPTYNNLRTKDFFGQEVEHEGAEMPRVYYMEDEGYDGVVKDPTNAEELKTKKLEAFHRIYSDEGYGIDKRVGIGVYYQAETPTYADVLQHNIPILKEHAPVDLPYYDAKMNPTTDLTAAQSDLVI